MVIIFYYHSHLFLSFLAVYSCHDHIGTLRCGVYLLSPLAKLLRRSIAYKMSNQVLVTQHYFILLLKMD
jgi:hypothetical protein